MLEREKSPIINRLTKAESVTTKQPRAPGRARVQRETVVVEGARRGAPHSDTATNSTVLQPPPRMNRRF